MYAYISRTFLFKLEFNDMVLPVFHNPATLAQQSFRF